MPTPNTLVRTSHALTIKVGGTTVGLINGWNPTQGRTITPIFEVGEDDSGNPVESVPGNVTGLTIAISRFDIYKIRMEEAFGTPDLVMLTRQSQPFEVMEIWEIPEFINLNQARIASGGDKERFIYQKCWFSSLGRTIRSDDNRVVNVNATLVYTKKLRVSGVIGSAIPFTGIKLGNAA